ncbi:aminotransferase class IV [Gloeobacter kilaueensis]|uniref:Branched-chain amino acid aminotransferase n=1 Tax=Gloeobacter kilaueensis (strain ATCC BAA-2537 / CCAP 1431/1 / ULC 316 / JS1) TaxID=1183438 RepID=U5QCX8_GLOK1|nr:aminotransferase class IV [Gloeobacter kilaueensis]AGY56736.1 branched-chain amino acid aminotransferase [Gloeobacter kilaueensis JS1]
MGLLVNYNGTIAPEASVSVLDRSFLYGDGVYEVTRTLAGRPVALGEHLERLRASARYLYLDVPWSDAQIEAQVERTLEAADNAESYIRIVVSRGAEEEISLLPGPEIAPALVIVVRAIAAEPVLDERGVQLVVVPRLRNDAEALSPAAKTGNYLNNILALIEARQLGADDAVLLNRRGELTEATTSNLWLVREGVVLTPATGAGILHGITRHFLLELLSQWQLPHTETTLHREDLYTADEAFLSSSVRLIAPVRRFDDYLLPACPGALTRRLWQGLLDKLRASVGVEAVSI